MMHCIICFEAFDNETRKPFAFSPCGHCYCCSCIHLAILNYPILTCFECRTPVELIIPNWLVIAIINQTNQYGMPVLQPDTIIEYNQRNTFMHLYNQRDQNAATVRLFILYLMLNDIYEEIRELVTYRPFFFFTLLMVVCVGFNMIYDFVKKF